MHACSENVKDSYQLVDDAMKTAKALNTVTRGKLTEVPGLLLENTLTTSAGKDVSHWTPRPAEEGTQHSTCRSLW